MTGNKPLIIIAAVAGGLLAGCQTEGPRDISGKYIGERQCTNLDPYESTIDWSSWGSDPTKAEICKYGERLQEIITFSNGYFKYDLSYFDYYKIQNIRNYRKLITYSNLKSDPAQVPIRKDSSKLGPMLVATYERGPNYCLGFSIFVGAEVELIGGETGTKSEVRGNYCQLGTANSENFESDALERIKKLRLGPMPPEARQREPEGLPPSAQQAFEEYQSSPKYGDFKAFAVDPSRGSWGRSWGYYDPNVAIYRALALCRERSQDCILWAVGNTVVSRISPEQVEAVTALASRENALGPDHADVAVTLNTLAERQRTQENYAGAEPLYMLALAIFEKALKPGQLSERSPLQVILTRPLATSMAATLENYAALLRETGRTSEATKMEGRAKAIHSKYE